MPVPFPRSIDQNESMARIAEPLLQEAPRGSGYAVVGDRRVAIVSDARDRTGLFGVGISQRGIKMIERARGIVDQTGRTGIRRVARGRCVSGLRGRRPSHLRRAAV